MTKLTKEQIEARFELQLLNPLVQKFKDAGRRPTVEDVAKAWFTFLDICKDSGEINHHQHSTWVLSKKYIEKFR